MPVVLPETERNLETRTGEKLQISPDSQRARTKIGQKSGIICPIRNPQNDGLMELLFTRHTEEVPQGTDARDVQVLSIYGESKLRDARQFRKVGFRVGRTQEGQYHFVVSDSGLQLGMPSKMPYSMCTLSYPEFQSLYQNIKYSRTKTEFTRALERIYLVIAHNDSGFIFDPRIRRLLFPANYASLKLHE